MSTLQGRKWPEETHQMPIDFDRYRMRGARLRREAQTAALRAVFRLTGRTAKAVMTWAIMGVRTGQGGARLSGSTR